MWGAKRSQGVRNCEMWQIVPYNCASESNIVEVQIFYISADHPHYFALFVTWFNWLWKDIWIHVAENCFFSSSYNNGISLESKYLKTLLYSDKSLMSLRNTSSCCWFDFFLAKLQLSQSQISKAIIASERKSFNLEFDNQQRIFSEVTQKP